MNQNKNHGQDIIINLRRTLVYKKDKFALVISEHLPINKRSIKVCFLQKYAIKRINEWSLVLHKIQLDSMKILKLLLIDRIGHHATMF